MSGPKPSCKLLAVPASEDRCDPVSQGRRYAELRDLAFAGRAIVPPAFRTEDEQLAQTVTAGARSM